MPTPVTRAPLPTDAELLEGLVTLFGRKGEARPTAILERRPNPYASTFASERVTCRLEDGCALALFCKYGGSYSPNDGHHGGVAYEATVYEKVLPLAEGSFPKHYGSYSDPAAGEVWLVLEALDEAVHISKADGPAMTRAAAWLGRFHAYFDGHAPPSCLRRYDAAYYRGWARRTAALAAPLWPRFPWLPTLCERFETVVPLLLETNTVIHGEFYPHNVLVLRGVVLPVDWESAALGAGEIDLVCLTDHWPEDVAGACAAAYARARLPAGAPTHFERDSERGFKKRLSAAEFYVHLRWLGDRPEWTLDPRHDWRFERLERALTRLGLL